MNDSKTELPFSAGTKVLIEGTVHSCLDSPNYVCASIESIVRGRHTDDTVEVHNIPVARIRSAEQSKGDPYTPEQSRVAKYIVEISGIGGGDDPIGFLIASHAALVERNKQAYREPQPLREFCREILGVVADGHDLDGADLQELAVKHGLLKEVTVTEPCGESCMCNEVCGEFPMTCYERTEIVK